MNREKKKVPPVGRKGEEGVDGERSPGPMTSLREVDMIAVTAHFFMALLSVFLVFVYQSSSFVCGGIRGLRSA